MLPMKRRPPAAHVADSDTFELREEAVVRGLVPLAHVYYSVALRAAHQGVAFDAGPVEWNRAPYIAVFFAFAAAEAYLPELHRSPTATQAQGLDKTKLKPAITPWKAQKALEVAYAAGEPNAGSLDWYKGLRCLRILRNELVHFKAQAHRLDEWPPRLLKADCRSVVQGWVAGAHDWSSQLLVRPVAVWACQTVRLAIEALHSRVGGLHPWSAAIPLAQRWREVV